MDAQRTKSAAACACVAALAIAGFALFNRPNRAAAAQRWSTQRLIEQVDTQPVHLELLTDAGVEVVEEGSQCGCRWAKLRMPGGDHCNVYLDAVGRIDSITGPHDPRGKWNDKATRGLDE